MSNYWVTIALQFRFINCINPLEVISPKNNLKTQNQATIDPWINLTSPMINETPSQGIQIPIPDSISEQCAHWNRVLPYNDVVIKLYVWNHTDIVPFPLHQTFSILIT